MSQQQYDAIIIGAGHNGLVCAAYLAKAGLKTLVLERRSIVGGCATTEEIPSMPGFKFNLCAIDHVYIHYTPIIKDLELERFGLEYISVDPAFFCPFPDGNYIFVWKDVNKTASEIQRVAGAREARAFLEFAKFYSKLWETITPAFLAPPVPLADMFSMLPSGPEREELIRTLLMSAEQLLEEWFDTDYVKGPAAKFAAEIGIDIRDPGTALLAGEITRFTKITRPRGGTGMLTQALARVIEHYGGVIRTNAEVEKIIVKDGKAVGVRLTTGEEIRAKGVISNLDAIRVFTKLVDPEHLEQKFRRRIEKLRVNYGLGLTVHAALNELPRFSDKYPVGKEANIASTSICPSIEYLNKFFDDIRAGRPPKEPNLWVATPSALDPTLAPPGKHTLYIYSHQPYKLADGKQWSEIKEEVADICINKLAEFAPNIKDAIIARYVESPVDMERRTGNLRGSFIHIDMSLAQLFYFRPLPELSQYRTPIKNLYLTGAGTHPGGGITGMPGYNTAHVFLEDWKAGKIV